MKKLIPLLLILSVNASASVVGMVSATPEHRVEIEVVERDGTPWLTIKRWGNNCPIQFVAGHVYNPQAIIDGKEGKIIVLSLFDGPPQTGECPKTESDRPGLHQFRLDKLLGSLEGAAEEFFERGAQLALVLQEFRPGGYDASLALALAKQSEITSDPRTIYSPKWRSTTGALR